MIGAWQLSNYMTNSVTVRYLLLCEVVEVVKNVWRKTIDPDQPIRYDGIYPAIGRIP